MNLETKKNTNKFAAYMVDKIKKIGSLNDEGYLITMNDLIEEINISGIDFKYICDFDYKVLFEDNSSVYIDEKNGTIKQANEF